MAVETSEIACFEIRIWRVKKRPSGNATKASGTSRVPSVFSNNQAMGIENDCRFFRLETLQKKILEKAFYCPSKEIEANLGPVSEDPLSTKQEPL